MSKKKTTKKKTKEQAEEKTQAELAVERFEEADQDLRGFMTDNPDFMDELRRLVDNFNASAGEAAKAVKAQLKSSGQKRLIIGSFGAITKQSSRWDGNKLAALIPARISQRFLNEVVAYEVNVDVLEQMMRQGEIDPVEANKAYVESKASMAMIAGSPKGDLNI